MMHETAILLGGLVVLALFLARKASPAPAEAPTSASAGGAPVPQLKPAAPIAPGVLPRWQVEQLAQEAAALFPGVSWRMLVTMAWIESSWRPGVTGDDGTSFGLMQVLRTTAQWLAGEMGASLYGRHLSDAELLRPEVSMYLGAAYVAWLSRYRGVPRSEEWIVRGYNGGPGWATASDRSLSMTLNHWTKYQRAKVELGFA